MLSLLDDAVPTIDNAGLVTKGIKANRNREFNITLSGKEAYFLLETLRDLAIADTHYEKVRAVVIWESKIRAQLEEQGF